MAVGKILPITATSSEAFESARDLSLADGDVFDCVLAYTAKGKVDAIWTEKTEHFKAYSFLGVENPLEWKWEEKLASG